MYIFILYILYLSKLMVKKEIQHHIEFMSHKTYVIIVLKFKILIKITKENFL